MRSSGRSRIRLSLRNIAIACSAGSVIAVASQACNVDPSSSSRSAGDHRERPSSVTGVNGEAALPDASPRVAALRARFPGVFGAASTPGVRVERAAGGDLAVRLSGQSGQSGPSGASVALPARADGAARVTDRDTSITARFTLLGAAHVEPAAAGDLVVYPGASPFGGDLVHRVGPEGTEDLIVVDAAPAREALRYRVETEGLAGLRLVGGVLELLAASDGGGVPVLRVAAPYVIDQGGARREARLSIEGCAYDASPRPPFHRAATLPGASACTVTVAWDGAGVRYPAVVDPAWQTTKTNMVAARTRHTITLLDPADPASLALITGGFSTSGGVALKSAEIYDPLSRRFSVTGSMSVARGAHTATLLSTSTAGSPVLVAGGADASSNPIASLEVYDPASGVFVTDANTMAAAPRFEHTATLTADHTVLLAGGTAPPLNQPTNTAYVYSFTGLVGSPSTAVTSALALLPATMASSRTAHTATLLGSGKVLLAGGFVLAGGALQALQNAEIFDPAGNTFGPITTAGGGIATMTGQRGYHTATLLPSGRVMIVGGLNKTVGGTASSTVDFYSDGQGGVTGFVVQLIPVNLATGRAGHSATLLTNGDVVVAGGFLTGGSATATVEVFSAAAQTFSALTTPAPMVARGDHAALLVNAGVATSAGKTVLVTGGANASGTGAQATANAQILLRNNGESCTQDDECLSGHCADAAPGAGKMCCDTSCDQVCYACSAAGKGSGLDGTCGYASGTTVLGWKCVPTTGQEVEILQGCDGQGNVIPFQTNKCVPNRCNGDRCGTDCPCSDAGFCSDAAVEAGPDEDAGMDAGAGGAAPDAGGGGSGGTGGGTGGSGGGADAGSPPDAGAPASGLHCEDRKPEGVACTRGNECNSGACVDGYCCNVQCTGQCEACDIPGKYGFCYPLGSEDKPEDPHLGGLIDFDGNVTPRSPCDGQGSACVGTCQGEATACTYPGSTTKNQIVAGPPTCTLSAGAAVTTTYSCNGAGVEIGTPHPCGGFKCQDVSGLGDAGPGDAGVSCRTSCSSDNDCIDDFICDAVDGGSGCVPLTGPLCDGKHTLRNPSSVGPDEECAGNLACPDGGTTCLSACTSVHDCVNPYICDPSGACVYPPDSVDPTLLPSCAAAPPAPGRTSGAWPAAFAFLALAALRRRRRG